MSNGDSPTGGRERAAEREAAAGWLWRRMRRRRCRVIAGVVALLTVAGVVLGGVVIGGGFGSAASGDRGSVGAGVPPSPSALGSLASAPVPPLGDGSAAAIPSGFSLVYPTVRADGAQAQKLVDDAGVWLRDWVAAWFTGNVSNPGYKWYCAMECQFFLDSTVQMWAHAHLRPAGVLRVYNVAAEVADGGYAGSVTMCVDDSGLYALTSSNKVVDDPFPKVGEVMYVFGGAYDISAQHWVMTQGTVTLGGFYCEATTTPH